MRTRFLLRGVIASLVAATFWLVVNESCLAQSYAPPVRSVIPWLSYIETYTGPLLPPGPVGSTFRSEFGAGMAAAQLKSAKFTGSKAGELNLSNTTGLDGGPLKFDLFANVRLWRVGLRASYTDFETKSKHKDFGKVDVSGLILGGDFDLLYQPWCAFGVRTDWYMLDPTFRGVLRAPDGSPDLTLDVRGNRPVTVGLYLRYTPPEILNVPLHIEVFYDIPFKGTRLISYGMKLAFRPQIYRLDFAARILIERSHLKFQATPHSEFTNPVYPPSVFFPGQNWELDMEWDLAGIDFTLYF